MRYILALTVALTIGIVVGVAAQEMVELGGTYRLTSTVTGTFLWNTRTGDTWRFFVADRGGWRYHALPPTVDACTVEKCGTLLAPKLPNP